MDEGYHFRLEQGAAPGAPLLLLLHGTGGDETQFLTLGRQLAPSASLLSPRGDVSEHGAARFFRRTGEGVYDMDDLARATAKLAGFLADKIAVLKPGAVMALGYSNGANILASLLFSAPDLVGRAVLMHPLIPFTPPAQPGLAGRPVLITGGRRDPITPAALTVGLERYFLAQGAAVQTAWHDGGHEIRQEELRAVAQFLA